MKKPAKSELGGLTKIDQCDSDALEDQGTVGATKAKVVLYSHFQLGVTRHIGAVVQIAVGIMVGGIF